VAPSRKVFIEEGDRDFWKKLKEVYKLEPGVHIEAGTVKNGYHCLVTTGQWLTFNGKDRDGIASGNPTRFVLLSESLTQKALTSLILLCREKRMTCGFRSADAQFYESVYAFGEDFSKELLKEKFVDHGIEVVLLSGNLFGHYPADALEDMVDAGIRAMVIQESDEAGNPLSGDKLASCLLELVDQGRSTHAVEITHE
jgi:hypothetical protein